MTLTNLGTRLSNNPEVKVPRSEYPRPDRDRSHQWLTLNGEWSFEADGIVGSITVPFAWETEASGIGLAWLEQGSYRRNINLPTTWENGRVVLCFGAVHHHCVVRIDGKYVGEHTGGYDSFEFDITDQMNGEISRELVVEVTAPADKRSIPHGKQRSIPRDDYDGVSFTPTSGIWQPVWLEARGNTYAQQVTLRGDSLTGIDVEIDFAGDAPEEARVTLSVDGALHNVNLTADSAGRTVGRIDLPQPRLWSPQDPHLYRVEVRTTGTGKDDLVFVTTGLRKFEARGEQLFLNGERYYMRGVLDQGYFPETGMTAPDAETLLRDISLARELGYNLVRKHLKFEEPIWLHEADRTGMLVWAEPACPSRFSEEAARGFEAQLAPMVERDGNHPSIIIWGLYNEEWGLDWDIPGSQSRAEAAIRAYDAMKKLDDTRPIVENSGWSHVKTDLVDWHYYEPDLAVWKDMVAALADGSRSDFPVRLGPNFTVDKSLYASDKVPRTGLPIINSEYGEGFTSLERAWHLRWETQELRRHDRFAGYVYTEFADVEHEAAGLLDEWRRPKEWGGTIPADVNADTVLVIDLIPRVAGADLEVFSEDMSLDVHISHHGSQAIEGNVQVAWERAGYPTDRALTNVETVSQKITVDPFQLSEAIQVHIPARPEPGRLLMWFVDQDETILARAFLDAAEVEEPNRRGARTN